MINRYEIIKLRQIEDTGGYDEELDDLIEAEDERLLESGIDMIEEARRGYRTDY